MDKVVDIKDISGTLLLSTSIEEGSKRKFLLMKEDYITLKFSLETPVHFKLGDYVDDARFGLFEVCDLQKPAYNTSTGGYDYDLRLDAYYWKWKNKIFKYTPEAAGREASWNLTAPLDVQAGVVLRNLKALGYTYKGQDFDFSIDSSVEDKSLPMSYDNINILDACFEMAKKWDCECWVTENFIYFGRLEHSDPVNFEIGVNVEDMTRSDSQSNYATRIYAFGSTRNIPATYRKKLVFDVKELPSVAGYRTALIDTARKLLPSYFRSENLSPASLTTSSYPQTKEMRVPRDGAYRWHTTYSLTERPGNTYVMDFSEFSAYVTGDAPLSVDVSLGVILCSSISDETGEEIELATLSLSGGKRIDIPSSSFSRYTFKSSGKFFLKVFQRIHVSGKDILGALDATGWCNGKFSYREQGTAARTSVTFISGPSAGKTFDAVFNPGFLPEGDAESGIVAISSAVPVSRGDRFTLDGLVPGKVPASYFTGDIDEDMTVNGVVQKRLMLPASVPYIDAYPEMTTEEAVEAILVYDDIYPRRTGTMSGITTKEYTDKVENDDGTTTEKKWNAYRFKDTGITFSEEYRLPDEPLKITFQSGVLNGMEFEVVFDPDEKREQLWEIIRNEDYGRPLPDDVLKPQPGDTYILSGFDSSFVSEGMVPAAEKELETRARKDAEKMKIDPSTYTSRMRCDEGFMPLDAGARVNLINKAFFDTGSRQSRVIGFEYNLDIPYDYPVYTVGETASYSRIAEWENKIESITLKGQTYTGKGGTGSGIYLIKSNDTTPASDSNTYSAKRIQGEIAKLLRKDKEDSTDYLTGFNSGITIGSGKKQFLDIVRTTDTDTQPSDTSIYTSLTTDNAFRELEDKYIRKDRADETAFPVKFKAGLSLGENILLNVLLSGNKEDNLTDETVLSALRTASEIQERALSRLKDDTAKGHIDFEAGFSINGKQLTEVLRYFDEERGVATDTNVYTALMTDERIRQEFDKIGDKFIRKDIPDEAHKRITFEEGITVLDIARMLNLEVSELATLAQAVVGILRSERFVDGFAGEGFQIWKYLASGDWNLTIDRVTVRKVMSIYELVIQKIRSVGGSLVVSAGNGKVATAERIKDHYVFTFEDENTFRYCDLARCQVFTGSRVKYYWVKVSSVRGGRVYVPVSEFEGVVPEAGDEWVLMGNTTDKKRQNLILISATGDGQPRIDVYDGVKSKNLEGCLRTRTGNLDGISDSRFLADMQPRGDGLYGNNCFLTGVFVLSNGQDVQTRFEIMEGMIKSEISSVRHEANTRDNYLFNSSFTSDMEGWSTVNDIRLFTVGGRLLYFNRNTYSDKKAVAAVTSYESRHVLRLRCSSLMQKNEDFASHPVFKDAVDGDFNPTGRKQAGMFYISFKYKVVETGTLQIYFTGDSTSDDFEPFERMSYTGELAENLRFDTFEVFGRWDGRGDLVIEFTGDMYLHSLALTSNSIDDLYDKFSTRIEQTDRKIQANADELHRMSESLEEYHTELTITARSIRSELSEEVTTLTGVISGVQGAVEGVKGDLSAAEQRITVAYRGEIEASARGLTATFTEKTDTLTTTLESYRSDFELTAKNMTLEFREDVNGLSSDITGLSENLSAAEQRITTAYTSAISASAQGLTADFSSRLTNLETGVTEAYTSAISVSAKELSAKFTAEVNDVAEDLAAAETRITTAYQGAISVSAKGLTTEFQSKVDTIYSDIDSAEQRITTAYEGKISASAQGLTADYTKKVNDVSSSLSTFKLSAEQSLSAHASSISSLNGAVSTAKSVADSAQRAADSAGAAASNAQGKADDAYNKAVENATAIVQTNSAISAIAGRFDSDGHLIEGAGWLTTAEGNNLWASKTLENGETIVSEINQTAESIKIAAKNIRLEGLVTTNENFQILPDGSMKTVNAHLSGNIFTPSFIITEDNWRDALLIDYHIFPYINWEVTGMNVQINYWPDLSSTSSVISDILTFPVTAKYVGCEANILILVQDTNEMQFSVATRTSSGGLSKNLRQLNPFEYIKLKLIDCKGLNTFYDERYLWALLNRQSLIG